MIKERLDIELTPEQARIVRRHKAYFRKRLQELGISDYWDGD